MPATGSAALNHPTRGIALFGGAFDPPHVTHQRIGDSLFDQLPVDALWVLPSGNHPFKGHGMTAAGAARVAMCRIAFAGRRGVTIDDRELHRREPSYTADILAEIRGELAAAGQVPPLYWVIGSDNLRDFHRWRDPERVLEQARLVVFPRADAPIDPARAAEVKAIVLDVAADNVNATAIRAELAETSPHPDLDPRVEAWIRAKGLYGTG